MSNADIITLPKLLSKVPEVVSNLPGLIKGSRMAKITDTTKPLGLGVAIERATGMNPNGAALIYEDTELTYKQFNAWTNRLADYLASIGLKKGDTIAVNIENRPELLVTVAACAKLGVCAALINTSQRGKVLIHSFNLVKPKAAIVGEELVQAVEEVRGDLDLKDNFFFFADQDTLENPGEAPSGYKNLASEIKDCSSENPASTKQTFLRDPLFYIYTSGTTGLPKAVVFNHGRWEKAYGGFGYSAVRLNKEDRLYTTLPFYHATGMVICWTSVLAPAGTLVLARKFSASGFWDDVRRHGCTAFGYVGELCRYLHEQPEKPNDQDNKIHTIVGNGLRPSIWKDFKERFGIERVVELYASSEGNVAFTNVFNFDNTVGFSPVSYAIVKYDKEKDEPVRDSNGNMIKVGKGESGLMLGEITDKTPFDGYTDPEKTEKSIFRNVFKKGDAWFNTGDVLKEIGCRHLQFVDRMGDTFRWKGENVSTTEVENIIDGTGMVEEAIVYGVEIPKTNGKAGMVTLVPQSNGSAFDINKLFDYLQENLPAYAVPVFVRVTNAIEKTGTFKYRKVDIQKLGYSLERSEDDVYAWLPGSSGYTLLTPELVSDIDSGDVRF